MPFSEEDLRRALRRKTPGANFTQRVLARIEQVEGKNKPVQTKRVAPQHGIFSFGFWPKGIVAFAATLVVAVGFVQYDRYETHVRQEAAKKQALLGIEITSVTLNQALHRALVRPQRLQ
jgi:hypothetical protein